MADPVPDEDLLLAVLNSTPVVDGVPTDDLADPARARAWLASAGGAGTAEELRHVREVPAALQAVVPREQPPALPAPVLRGAAACPALTDRPAAGTPSAAPEPRRAARAGPAAAS